MHLRRRNVRTNLLRSAVVLGATALLTGVLPVGSPLTARAATLSVACNGSGDIGKLQSAVNTAGNGDTITISGVCDLSGANPHGGTATSINHTAVLIRPGTPVTGLTITSAVGPQQAKLIGSGSQTAFAVAPGNDGTVIKGLIFENLARPVVVLGADDVIIGSQGPTPNINGNRILGGVAMDSAILAVGSSASLTVAYGGIGGGSATFVPGDLRRLTVEGNYVSYAPPGTGDPSGNADVVAIDVRQSGTALVDDVTITHNAVGMFTSDFATFRQNAIRVMGMTAVAAPTSPALTSFRIRNIDIVANNLGRLEELDPANLPGVNTGDAHAGGRAAIVVARAGNVNVTDNSLRARISVTGAAAMPGGGIVIGDSAHGTVARNDIVVLSDAGTDPARDLGAVGVAEGLMALNGDTSSDQGTFDIAVHSNVIGRHVPARRGLVVTGADKITVFNNDVLRTTGPGLSVGADVQGPTGQTLSTKVTRIVACDNRLWSDDPTKTMVPDDTEEVSYYPHAQSTGNAFPGGGNRLQAGDNTVCTPSLTVSPAPPDAVEIGEQLTASGRAWASRTVRLRVVDDDGAVLTKTTTANTLGTYTVVLTDTELSVLTDGLLRVTAIAEDPAGATRASEAKPAFLDLVGNPPGVGQVTIDDGGDGYTNNWEAVAGAPVYWTAPSAGAASAILTWTDGAGNNVAEPACGPWTNLTPQGMKRLPIECAAALPQGTYRAKVQWRGNDSSLSAVVFDTSILDTVNAPPVITSPAESVTITSNTVTLSGTAEASSTVIIETWNNGQVPGELLGNVVADGSGTWSTTLPFANGTHRIKARSIDVAGNQSGASGKRTFHVNADPIDLIAPNPPLIATPLPNSLNPKWVTFKGTAEPRSTVRLYIAGIEQGQAQVDVVGNWQTSPLTVPYTGSWTYQVTATDEAGNESAPTVLPLVIDVVAPELKIDTAQDRPFLIDEVLIEGRVRDDYQVNKVQVEYYDFQQKLWFSAQDAVCIDAGCQAAPPSWARWEHDPNIFFPPGIYYARAIAYDLAGNASDASVRFITIR